MYSNCTAMFKFHGIYIYMSCNKLILASGDVMCISTK